jgi:4-deoxy-L-threo-5-hexosulose-uronate ketol-isomerase
MPPHTHMRRSEVYCYFQLAEDSVVMHFMGPPSATRNLVMRDGHGSSSSTPCARS